MQQNLPKGTLNSVSAQPATPLRIVYKARCIIDLSMAHVHKSSGMPYSVHRYLVRKGLLATLVAWHGSLRYAYAT